VVASRTCQSQGLSSRTLQHAILRAQLPFSSPPIPRSPCTTACPAGARSSLSYRSSLRHATVSVKVQLPHERYNEMAARLPELIERSLQQAAGGAGGAAALSQRQATAGSPGSSPAQAGAAASAPRLLTYTHFQGCLAAVLQFESEHALPPASRVEAELLQMLPEGMQLAHVCMQQGSGGSAPAGGVWPDPVAVESNSASCSLDVVLPPGVLQQLAAGAGQQQQQLRVVLAVAVGEVLSDGVVEVEARADLAGGGGAVKVRRPAGAAPAGQHYQPSGTRVDATVQREGEWRISRQHACPPCRSWSSPATRVEVP